MGGGDKNAGYKRGNLGARGRMEGERKHGDKNTKKQGRGGGGEKMR